MTKMTTRKMGLGYGLSEICMADDPRFANVVVHGGIHHGDDALAVAMVALLKGSAHVWRTTPDNAQEELAAARRSGRCNDVFICDVGGMYDPAQREYDHHQRGFSEKRPDGTPMSSASLFWRDYGARICSGSCPKGRGAEAAEIVDRMLLTDIDAGDAGRRNPDGSWSLYTFLGSTNLTYYERTTADPYALNSDMTDDDLFLEACLLAELMLWRTIEQARSIVFGRQIVETAIANAAEKGSKIVELPSFIEEWRETIIKSGADMLFGLYRDKAKDQWVLQAVPTGLDAMNSQRHALPIAWRGLSGPALQETTGVAEALFCHPSGFMLAAKTREAALALAELAMA